MCFLINFIYLLIIQSSYYIAYTLSQNFTNQVVLGISIDGKLRNNITLGLYGQHSPKATYNFLNQCQQDKINMTLLKLRVSNNTKKDVNSTFNFNQKPIYNIYENEFMQFGDYFQPSRNAWKGNYSIFGGPYYSEINDFHTEIGALAQERNLDNGDVGSEYTIFFKRANFDGRSSPWHVFGAVTSSLDFLKYISYTAGDNNGIPRRDVNIEYCYLIK